MPREKDIKEGKAFVSFNFHGKLNLRGNAIKMRVKVIKCDPLVLPNDKSVIDKPEPTLRLSMPAVESLHLKEFHKDVSDDGRMGKLDWHTFNLFINHAFERKESGQEANFNKVERGCWLLTQRG